MAEILFTRLEEGFFHYDKFYISFIINPSRPNPGPREKINLNFYFHTSLRYLKRLYEGLKGFHKTFRDTMKALKAFIKSFEVPQRSVKIKI